MEIFMPRSSMTIALVLLSLGLSSCGEDPKTEVANLDETLLGKGNSTDPVLTSALEDQIMVDPALTGQANTHAVRAADKPAQTPIPTEATGGPAPSSATPLGQRVAEQTAKPAPGASYPSAAAAASVPASTGGSAKSAKASFNGCGMDVSYSMAWSARMPSDLPLYPQAKVAEAAGSDSGACRLRAVTFSTAAAPRNLVDYYLSTARKAGYQAEYTTEGGEQMVAGHRGDGAAFYVILTPRQSGGTMADMVANRGA
jgi:hypothetical protein